MVKTLILLSTITFTTLINKRFIFISHFSEQSSKYCSNLSFSFGNKVSQILIKFLFLSLMAALSSNSVQASEKICSHQGLDAYPFF